MSLVNDYYGKCATCENYALGSKAHLKPNVGYTCYKYKKAMPLDESCGSHILMAGYSRNKRVTDHDISSAKKAIGESNCFITTTVVNMLGLDDHSEVLETLREFRDKALQVNPKYHFVLEHYDRIGPEIAYAMQNDSNGKQVAEWLYQRFLSPVASIISLARHISKETEEIEYIEPFVEDAVIKYINMTQYLAQKYEINNTYYEGFEYCDQLDARLAGHGRKRTTQ